MKKKVETKKEMSPEELKAMVKAERDAREVRAMARIQKILEEERCEILPLMLLTNNGISGRIEVKAQA